MQVVSTDAVNGSRPAQGPGRGTAEVDRLAHGLALVVWRDAWFELDLAESEHARSDYLVRTVGFLIAHGPRFVSLAQEILPDGEGYRAVTHIPLEVVDRITRLEPSDALVTG